MKPDDLLINLIKKLPTIKPRYNYPNEKSINPTYCDIEHCAPLCPNDKKIWVLRGDLILAVGNKNAYAKMGNTPILNSVDESVQHYIDKNDRYGHPSLAMPEGYYTGDAYYAGWLYQHTNHIKVYLCSGRYQNDKINQLEQRYLEHYVSMQFMEAFGEQDIVFHEYDNDYEMELFLRGKPFPVNTVQRTYSPSMIKHENVLDLAIKYHGTQTAMQLLEAGVKPNKCIKDFIQTGDLVGTQLLIKCNGKLLNNLDEFGYAPLHYAVHSEQLEIVRYLISKGADLNIRTLESETMNYSNMSAMDILFARKYNEPLIILLYEAGASASLPQQGKYHMIHLLAKNGLLHHVESLIQQNPALVHLEDRFKQTPLLWAAANSHTQLVDFLIKQGADVNVATHYPSIDEHNNSPLDWAIRNKHIPTIKRLIEAQAIVNKYSDDSLYLEDKLVNSVAETPPIVSDDASSQEQLSLNDNTDSSTGSYFYQLTSMISSSGSLIFNSLFTDTKHSRTDDAPINEEDRDPKRRKK